jgi:hypothetical protein
MRVFSLVGLEMGLLCGVFEYFSPVTRARGFVSGVIHDPGMFLASLRKLLWRLVGGNVDGNGGGKFPSVKRSFCKIKV